MRSGLDRTTAEPSKLSSRHGRITCGQERTPIRRPNSSSSRLHSEETRLAIKKPYSSLIGPSLSTVKGRIPILKVPTLGQDGRSREAIPLLRMGLKHIDPQKDPRLVFAGRHNLIGFVSESGAPGKAFELLEKNRHLHQDLGRMDLARAQWLEGKIANELGRFAKAK